MLRHSYSKRCCVQKRESITGPHAGSYFWNPRWPSYWLRAFVSEILLKRFFAKKTNFPLVLVAFLLLLCLFCGVWRPSYWLCKGLNVAQISTLQHLHACMHACMYVCMYVCGAFRYNVAGYTAETACLTVFSGYQLGFGWHVTNQKNAGLSMCSFFLQKFLGDKDISYQWTPSDTTFSGISLETRRSPKLPHRTWKCQPHVCGTLCM